MSNLGPKIRQFSGVLLLLSALILLTSIFNVLSPAADKTKIFFYSSETNINNFKSLKMEFDQYLSKFGAYEFQPFKGRETFEKHIKGRQNCLLVLSSWHYKRIYKEYSLIPAAIGVRNGSKYQKRILVVAGDSPGLEVLKAERIASSSSADHTGSVLKAMLKDKFVAGILRILTVPKDIDALMSVGFGMSKLALTTKNSFEELQTIHPALCKKMNVLLEGDETLLLILAVPQGVEPTDNKAVAILKGMARDPDGKHRIKMLGLDGWQDLDPSDMAKLES